MVIIGLKSKGEPARVDRDEKPALLFGVADGELHLACGVGVITGPEDAAEGKTTTQKRNQAEIKLHFNKKGGGGGSHGEGISLSDVEMRRNPSGDDVNLADFTVCVPTARHQLSVQDLHRQTRQHS